MLNQTAGTWRRFTFFALLCGVLIVGSYYWQIEKFVTPVERSLLYTQERMLQLTRSLQTPVTFVQQSRNGMQRIADLEQRLHDTVVDRALLIQLEGEVESLRRAAQINTFDWKESELVRVIDSQEKVVVSGGTRNGFEPGMMVVDASGALVGRLDTVGEYNAVLERIEEVEVRTAAEVSGKGIRAVLVGNGGNADLMEILQDAPIQVGDVIVTSGQDGKYPAGVLVAQVLEVGGITSDVTKQARVDLIRSVDDYVLVVKEL